MTDMVATMPPLPAGKDFARVVRINSVYEDRIGEVSCGLYRTITVFFAASTQLDWQIPWMGGVCEEVTVVFSDARGGGRRLQAGFQLKREW